MDYRLPQRPHLLKITPLANDSMVVKGDAIAWNNPWHYHPEVELLYCQQGRGTNFVGNSIRSIEEGELLLFGSNLPHTRQRDREYYSQHPGEEPQSVVVQFKPDFLGVHFFERKEFASIKGLLERSHRGLKFFGRARASVAQKLEKLELAVSSSHSILTLLTILEELAGTDEFIYLNSVNYKSLAHEQASQRINQVYLYTIEHFREPISLAEVADLTNHTPASFCRYFKARTRKSYFQYLSEIRIAYACEKLMEGNWGVSEVCFNSGFNNLSNFHKQFRRIMKTTPSEYRKRGLAKVPPEPA
jgi:AraC-like DNA-binding protein